jgi:hypothetical protein
VHSRRLLTQRPRPPAPASAPALDRSAQQAPSRAVGRVASAPWRGPAGGASAGQRSGPAGPPKEHPRPPPSCWDRDSAAPLDRALLPHADRFQQKGPAGAGYRKAHSRHPLTASSFRGPDLAESPHGPAEARCWPVDAHRAYSQACDRPRPWRCRRRPRIMGTTPSGSSSPLGAEQALGVEACDL